MNAVEMYILIHHHSRCTWRQFESEPLLYVLCMIMCQSKHEYRTILTFVDDSIIANMLHDKSRYGFVIGEFGGTFLELNTSKIKALIIDVRTRPPVYKSTICLAFVESSFCFVSQTRLFNQLCLFPLCGAL